MFANHHVLLLNADEKAMGHIRVQHAFRMISREVAVIHEAHPTKTFGTYPLPLQMRLVRYVNMSWFYAKPVIWCKASVKLRDGGRCAYCYGQADTIDHIVPTSKGGRSTWTNTVACCLRCNNKKGNRSLDEVGWQLQFTPRAPMRSELQQARITLMNAKHMVK